MPALPHHWVVGEKDDATDQDMLYLDDGALCGGPMAVGSAYPYLGSVPA